MPQRSVDGVVDRSDRHSLKPVVRDGNEVRSWRRPVVRLERPGGLRVELGVGGPGHGRGDRVGNEAVRERVSPCWSAEGYEDRRVDCRLKPLEHGHRAGAGHRGEQNRIDVFSEDGGRREQGRRVVG